MTITTIKLPKLPDRTPVKLAITILPDLHQGLQDYAAAYAEAYGCEVAMAELVPAILASFLEGDRTFQQRRKAT